MIETLPRPSGCSDATLIRFGWYRVVPGSPFSMTASKPLRESFDWSMRIAIAAPGRRERGVVDVQLHRERLPQRHPRALAHEQSVRPEPASHPALSSSSPARAHWTRRRTPAWRRAPPSRRRWRPRAGPKCDDERSDARRSQLPPQHVQADGKLRETGLDVQSERAFVVFLRVHVDRAGPRASGASAARRRATRAPYRDPALRA